MKINFQLINQSKLVTPSVVGVPRQMLPFLWMQQIVFLSNNNSHIIHLLLEIGLAHSIKEFCTRCPPTGGAGKTLHH